jgi:hypothetical protein
VELPKSELELTVCTLPIFALHDFNVHKKGAKLAFTVRNEENSGLILSISFLSIRVPHQSAPICR